MQVSTSQKAADSADSAAGEPPGKAKGKGKGKGKGGKGGGGEAARGASTVSSGVKLEDVSITFKNQQLLRGVSWEVKRGERVGLVGAPGPKLVPLLQAAPETKLQAGVIQPHSGQCKMLTDCTAGLCSDCFGWQLLRA